MSSQNPIPATPRVISPSPTPSERSGRDSDGYFPPTTRSATKSKPKPPAPVPINEEEDSDSSLELARARTRSRSPIVGASTRRRRMSGLTPSRKGKKGADTTNGSANASLSPNGGLSPSARLWRDITRSPSPLGLIPIHQRWRTLIHRHEIPRKALHVSIGFVTLYLYTSSIQPSAIHPLLLRALLPIALTDLLRHRSPAFNAFYVRCLGALMRESEVDGWNGVVWYLLGAWIALRYLPKDLGVMSVLLLSWCDTAASTAGRAWGRYTPRLRRGKSLAGTLAAFVVGAGTAAMFWGWLAPRMAGTLAAADGGGEVEGVFMYRGQIGLGWMSVWTGVVGAASEVVDVWGWDDNLTIPVLSGAGLWGVLKVLEWVR